MKRYISIATRTFLAPILGTRGMRLALLAFGLFGVFVVALVFTGMYSVDVMRAGLEGARHLLVMVGLPVAAVLTSEMALRDGIHHRTLLYPLLGPVPRGTLALVRTFWTGLLLAAGITVLLLLTRFLLRDGLALLPREILAVILGAFAYTALFGLLHVLNRRGLVVGLVLLFFLDFPLGRVPFSLRNLSPSYHVGVIAHQQESLSLPVPLALPGSSVVLSAAILIGITALGAAATALVFRRMSLRDLC
jgi:hypothetical protein